MNKTVSNERKFSLSIAVGILEDIADFAVYSKYSNRIDLVFDKRTDESHTGYYGSESGKPRSDPSLYCKIGIYEMYENMDDHGMVRDMDLVWAGKHVFHEASHMYDILIGYQSENPSQEILDAARMDAISLSFCGYHQSTYAYLPSELKADICGFEGVVSWFDTHLKGKNGMSLIDARSCLVQCVRELSAWRGNQYAPDYDSMVQSMKDRLSMQEYRYRDRGFALNTVDGQDPYKMKVCGKWNDVIDSEDRIGTEYDRKLFAVVLDMNSAGIDHFACLDDEVKGVRSMYPSRRSLFGRLEGYMDRRQNMKDMPDTESPFWVQKVLREADAMEMRQDGKDDWQFGG